jgi:Domain of unknown function (DUF4270)
VHRKFFLLLSAAAFFSWNCTKIDTTTIGADLIPAVDNVYTFADTLEVNGTQGVLTPDTTRIGISDLHVLGTISNDPLFGKTIANIYLQIKPAFFPYYFGNAKDSIGQSYAPAGTGYDSAVLCLSYKGFYGDSTKPQHLRVVELDAAETNFKFDSIYQANYQPSILPVNVIGEVTVTPADLKNYTFLSNKKDSVNYQIRIPLSNAFLNRILSNYDSSTNKPFNSDSLFTTIFKGFAVEAGGGTDANGLFYIGLTDAATRLEVHYRRKNITPVDTSYSSWIVVGTTSTVVKKSATASYVSRERAGSQYAARPSSSDELFIQATPGTYATLQIPGLSLLDNRIIHRAELVIEQIPSPATMLQVPSYLYLDAVDTGTTWKYKPLPYDLSPNEFYNPNTSAQPFYPSNGIDYNYFGGRPVTKTDPLTGKLTYSYVFNISRYVQNIVTKHELSYGLRLTAPYTLYYYGYSLPFSNLLGYGGIKIGNGNNANYKLRLRIVYSKI